MKSIFLIALISTLLQANQSSFKLPKDCLDAKYLFISAQIELDNIEKSYDKKLSNIFLEVLSNHKNKVCKTNK